MITKLHVHKDSRYASVALLISLFYTGIAPALGSDMPVPALEASAPSVPIVENAQESENVSSILCYYVLILFV